MNRTTGLETFRSSLDRGHWRCKYKSSGTLSSFRQNWQDDVWSCRIVARTKQWRRMYLGSNIWIAAMSSTFSLSVYINFQPVCVSGKLDVLPPDTASLVTSGSGNQGVIQACDKWAYSFTTHYSWLWSKRSIWFTPMSPITTSSGWPAGSLQASSDLT